MLGWSIKLFRIFGIRLELHFSFFLLPAIFAIQGYQSAGVSGAFWGIVLITIAFTCVVLHELGHSLTARKFDIQTERILLMPIGGMAQFQRLPQTPTQEIIITIAGPMVNFLIAGLLFPITGFQGYQPLPRNLDDLLLTIAFFNLAMGLFNLIPVFPMDGGRILRAVLSIWIRPLRATSIASKLGSFIATALGIFLALNATNPNTFLLAALFLFISYASRLEYRSLKRNHLLADLYARDFVESNFLKLSSEAKVSDAIDLISRNAPDDILIFEGLAIVGLLSKRDLKKIDDTQAHLQPISNLIHRNLPMIQSGSSIESVLSHPLGKKLNILPVYNYIDFLGVIRKNTIEDRAEWIQKRRRQPHPNLI